MRNISWLYALAIICLSISCAKESKILPNQDEMSGDEISPNVKWVKIEAGTFTFGSPQNTPCIAPIVEEQTDVTLTRSFFIAEAEVTQEQWSALNIPNPSQNKGDAKPVTFINFYEAAVWCNKLSKLEGLDTCYELSTCSNKVGTGCGPDEEWYQQGCWDAGTNFNCTVDIHKYSDYYSCPGYRLPTTAEWEYAAKAGTTTHTYNGDIHFDAGGICSMQETLEPIAWYCNNSGDEYHPVKKKLPNPWGLFDMLGNVYEWADYWSDGQALNNSSGETLIDPIGPSAGAMKDLRGGKYDKSGCDIRNSYQFAADPFDRRNDTGFRPVRTLFE